MKRKKILSLVSYFFHNFFIIILVLYLVLFLLENIFTGFVSNNFDLNIILIPLFILGILTAIYPQPEAPVRQTKPSILDYFMTAGFTVLTFVIVWYKLTDLGKISIFIALGSSLIVLLVSILMLFFPEDEINPVKKANKKLDKIRTFSTNRSNRPFIIAFFCLLIPLLVFFTLSARKRQKPPATVKQKILIPAVITPNKDILDQTPVILLNGNSNADQVYSIAKALQDKGVKIVSIDDADRKNYQHTLVQFEPEDRVVAEYILKILEPNNLVIDRMPLGEEMGKAKIIITIGGMLQP